MRGVGDAAPYKVRRECSAARGLTASPFSVCIVGRGLDPYAAARGLAALQSPESVCRHAGRRGRRPLQSTPRTFRRPRPNGIPLFRFALQGGVLTPPRRPVGRPPYGLPAVRAAPYKVRRAVGAGHARPAASRNRPFTVEPQGRDSSLPRRVPPPPKQKPRKAPRPARSFCILRQHRTIPALRLKHRSGGCGTASALPKCSIIHKVLSALLA